MSMKALAFRATGDEQVLELRQIARPLPGAEDVLIKVLAFAINPVRILLASLNTFLGLLTHPFNIGARY